MSKKQKEEKTGLKPLLQETRKKVNVRLLIRNAIWQTKQSIESGRMEPAEENVKSFWYAHIRPSLFRSGVVRNRLGKKEYKIFLKELESLVRAKVMSFADLGLGDMNSPWRRVGENTNIIIFTNKMAYFSMLLDFHSEHRVSVTAQFIPLTLVTNEYFTGLIKERTSPSGPFHVFSIIDYTPAGWRITNKFIEELRFFGLEDIRLRTIVHPDLLSPEQVKIAGEAVRSGAGTVKWFEAQKKKNYENLKYLKRDAPGSAKVEYCGLRTESVTFEKLKDEIMKGILSVRGSPYSSRKADEFEKEKNRTKKMSRCKK